MKFILLQNFILKYLFIKSPKPIIYIYILFNQTGLSRKSLGYIYVVEGLRVSVFCTRKSATQGSRQIITKKFTNF